MLFCAVKGKFMNMVNLVLFLKILYYVYFYPSIRCSLTNPLHLYNLCSCLKLEEKIHEWLMLCFILIYGKWMLVLLLNLLSLLSFSFRKEEALRKVGDRPEVQYYTDISKVSKNWKAEEGLKGTEAVERAFDRKDKKGQKRYLFYYLTLILFLSITSLSSPSYSDINSSVQVCVCFCLMCSFL